MAFNHERIWAEVDLDSLVYTYRQIKRMAGNKGIMPVIKADAYGHGAIMAAKVYIKEGAMQLAVATASEAMQLRGAGIDAPLLVLGTVPVACVNELAKNDIELCIPCMEVARQYADALDGYRLKIHVKIESGMNRLGFSGAQCIDDVSSLACDPQFDLRGVFTHFAASGERGQDEYTHCQHKAFEQTILALKQRGVKIPLIHCANSDAIVNFPEFIGDVVRPGIILYGYASPSPNLLPLKPALSLRCRISQVKWVEAGGAVGYSCTWTAAARSKIATISAGYADGLPRSGSSNIEMLLHGQRVKQVGRICMDMTMLDVTAISDVSAGDVVTIVGVDGDQQIWMDELAERCGTIPHEPLTQLTSRVPRFYMRSGRVIQV